MDNVLTAEQMDAELRGHSDWSVATLRKTRRRWSATLKPYAGDAVLALSLELLERFNHRWIAYELSLFHPGAFSLVRPGIVERLAGQLGSWGDVDQFAVLVAGPAWRAGQIDDGVVHAWASRPDRWWRRAALVATVPLNVKSQGGRGDIPRTLAVCERLLDDPDDMVIKAMSWALRELVVHDPNAVAAFLATHAARLASRVTREVRNKLTTGLKNPQDSPFSGRGSRPGVRSLL